MTWLLIALGSIPLLIAMLALVGAFLPKGHVASRKARFRQSPDAVFRVITDFASAPSWRSGVAGVEMLPPRDGKPSFREKGRNGSTTYVVDESTAPKRLVTRIVDNSAFGGTWTFELTPEPAGCHLAITERGEVYNPIFRVLGRLFFSQTATMEAYLRSLGQKLGEDGVPEA